MTVARDIATTRQRVWEVLADGWSYSGWVVGNSRIRVVSGNWPAPGARICTPSGPGQRCRRCGQPRAPSLARGAHVALRPQTPVDCTRPDVTVSAPALWVLDRSSTVAC